MRFRTLGALLAAAAVAAACAGNPATPEPPHPMERRMAIYNTLSIADNARSAGRLDAADRGYREVLALAPGNERAQAGLDAVAMERRHLEEVKQAQRLLDSGQRSAAYAKVKHVLSENPKQREARELLRRIEQQSLEAEMAPPKLSKALEKPVTLELRDAGLRQAFELLSKHSGLNFVFDKDVPVDARVTVSVKNTTIDDVIRFILTTNQLDRKVLNPTTLLVYPKAKEKDYRTLVVKSFYLANADAKQTANMIRSLVKTRDLFVDEKLNLLVMRDTPEAVRMAEKLVADQDLGEPEVTLDVEVLEVGDNKLTQLGVQWPSQIGVGVTGAAGVPGQITGAEAKHFDSGLVRLTFSDPLFVLNLSKQDGSTHVLANPRIRVKNREKAQIHIGDKVPVITTTAGATGFVSEAVNYLDVGLKLSVEPTVYLHDDVGIKIGLEVSNIARQVQSPSGTLAYQIGTRNATTTLRLKNGETQVLAGLIDDEDRRSANKVPGLGDMPVLGRLFGSHADTANRTEIVLLITPHVVNNLTRPGVRSEEFTSGTLTDPGAAPLRLRKAD